MLTRRSILPLFPVKRLYVKVITGRFEEKNIKRSWSVHHYNLLVGQSIVLDERPRSVQFFDTSLDHNNPADVLQTPSRSSFIHSAVVANELKKMMELALALLMSCSF